MARRQYSDETRGAVMAALLAGQSITSVSKEYNIPKGTVSGWKHRADGVAQSATQKREVDPEIGDLLLDYIRASLRTLKTQVEHFGDKTWLANQDADQLAVLHGVQTDKVIRLLEALAEADEPDADVP